MAHKKKHLIIRLFLSLILLICGLVFINVFPPTGYYLPVFYILIWLTLYLFIGVFLRYNLTLSVVLTVYLILRSQKLDNTINLSLLGALLAALFVLEKK